MFFKRSIQRFEAHVKLPDRWFHLPRGAYTLPNVCAYPPNKKAAMADSFSVTGAKKRCQELLKRPGTTISLQSSDGAFLMQLLRSMQRHHKAAEKIGCGITHFTVELSSVGGFSPAPHFVLHRLDSSSTDFSYNKCISSKPGTSTATQTATSTAAVTVGATSAAARVHTTPAGSKAPGSTSSSSSGWVLNDRFRYEALRKAVLSQRQAFKATFLRSTNDRVTGSLNHSQPGSLRMALKCPVTGVILNWSNTRIDYAGSCSFIQLADKWLQYEGIALSEGLPESWRQHSWQHNSKPQPDQVLAAVPCAACSAAAGIRGGP
jgi:hypothetical protein